MNRPWLTILRTKPSGLPSSRASLSAAQRRGPLSLGCKQGRLEGQSLDARGDEVPDLGLRQQFGQYLLRCHRLPEHEMKFGTHQCFFLLQGRCRRRRRCGQPGLCTRDTALREQELAQCQAKCRGCLGICRQSLGSFLGHHHRFPGCVEFASGREHSHQRRGVVDLRFGTSPLPAEFHALLGLRQGAIEVVPLIGQIRKGRNRAPGDRQRTSRFARSQRHSVVRRCLRPP